MSSQDKKRFRDAGSGEFVTEEVSIREPETTVSEIIRPKSDVEQFLHRLTVEGGIIAPAKNFTPEGITLAKYERRYFTDAEGNGYVLVAYERQWR